MRKRVLAAILAIMMIISLLPTSVSAATKMGYPPYANVEYGYSSGVTVGTIRYIAQNSASAYFYSSYWPSSTFGGYAGASTECGTACISMALSYVGVNRTPKVLLESTNGYTGEMWGTQGDATSSSIGISKSAIAAAMNNYINGNGKYSPLCIYIQPWSSTSSMHWVLLIGKISENTYLALNPWHTAGTNATLTMVINGTTATYNGVTNPITSVNQWYNPKAVTDLDTGTSRLKIEPTTVPAGNLTPGAAFSLQGTVTSNYKITNFEGSIIKASGAVQQSVSTTPNAYSVDIRSSNVNQNLVFGDYPNGKYKLHYYAKDASGNEVSWDSNWFWIGDTVVDNYYLDVNGWLDGAAQGSILQYGTFDVYVNGSPAADDVNDYYTQWPQGTAYSINDIRPARGYSYDGVYSGSRTGTVSADPTRIVLSFSAIDTSSITETPTQEVYNGHTYIYYQTPVTWYFAEEFCEAMGGHLVCVTSDGENSFVKSLISGNRAWLGATDIDSEGTWRWVSGEQFSYSDWDSGEPNNSTGGENSSEDYAHYNPNKWNDTTGCLTLGFVCEIDYACEHVYNYVVTKEPTKTEAGVLTGYCNLCDETVTITLPKLDTSNYTKSIIPGTCTTRTIERYEWNTKTYGIFSFDVVMGDQYSEWSTDYPTGVDASLIESRTEYRYSDYQTTTSYDTSMSGWTLKSSEWKQSGSGTINYVPSWPSGFSTSHSLYSQYNNTPKSASETTTDKTVINSTGTAGYIYWHWCRDNQQAYLESMNRLIKPVYSSEFHGFHAFFSTKTPAQLIAEGASHDSSDNSYVYRNLDCCKDSEWYFPLEVKSQSYTTYKKLFTYERWTDWSAWSTTVYTASSTRKVETRTLYRYITTPLVDHTWNEGEITTPATCTEAGVKTYTCTACNETRTEPIEMLGHDYVTTVTVPTCTEPGYTTHTCSRCGVSYTDASADATGHNIVNGVCTVCGLSFPVVSVGSVAATPGETLTVPITISNNNGFAGFTFVFNTDDALTITKIAKGDLLQSADSGSFTTNVSGGVVTWFDSVNTTGDGTLMLLTVAVADDAEEGIYSIHTALKDNNETNFVDESSQAIPVSFTDGAITVATPTVDAKLTVYGNPVTATPGSTITVPVLISGGENFAGFTLTISTSEALTLKSIEKGALLKDADGMFTKNIAQKTVNWTCSENLPGDGELMVLTFDVSEAAEDGDLTVSLALKDNKPTNMVDADERPVSTKFEDIIVTVSSVIYGDTNSDGEVDTADAVRLVRYLVDLVELTETQKKAADVNHDDDLTSADSIRLVRYLVGLVETLDKTSAAQPTRGRTPRQASSGATVDVGTVSGDPGATVTVPVTITGNTGFAGFTLEVSYPEGLTLTKVAKGTLLKESDGGALTSNVSKNLINWNDTENLSGDGQMLVLTFKISDTAESGDYAVSISPKDSKPGNFVDEEGTPVSATFNPGTVTVNAHEHQYVDVVTAPTCTEQGYTTHTCSVCGDSYVDTYVPALGHDWGEWVLTTPPTATTKGEETRTCNRCGETETRDVDPVKPTVTVADASGNNGDTITVPVNIANNTGFAGFTLEVEYPEGIQLTKVAKGTLLKESDGGALTSNVSKNLINWNDTENLSSDGQMLVLTFKISDTAEPGDYSVSLKLKDGKAGNFVDEEGNPVNAVFEAGTITVAPHEHQYVDVVTEPTCTEQGYTTHTCSICGDSYVDTYVPALGHDWSAWTVTTAPTCTEKGVETRTCSRCNETETRDVAALGHDLIHHDAQAPTCAEIGWNAYDTCSRCDYTTYEELPALGHNPGTAKKENNVEPTCTEAGSYDMVVRCTRCNEILESAHTDVPALGHDWSDWTVTTAPTCTEKGVETRTCSRCNETETRDVAALGHNLIHHDAQAPTCTEIGWNAYDTCSRCDYTTYEELPALGHNPGAAKKENNVEPTCTEAGSYDTVVRCTRCNEVLESTHTDVPALGHDWSDWTVTTAPTCTEKGVETRTCSRCNETETRDVAALGHDLIHHDAQAPTCTEIGWNAYDTCSRCDYTTYEELPELGHDWSAWTVTTAPTCTEKGVETRTCSRCNETETRDVAALGHDLIHHDAQAPTCTKNGWNAYDTCSRCDYTTYEELPALGHDWSAWTVTTAPTCTEKGVETRTCSRCNETETRDVAALGHDLIHHDAQAPTCTEIGWNSYDTCSRCDYTTYEELPALGHNPGIAKKENNVEPTCTEAGSYDMVVRCTRCNEILESTHTDVPALGHDLIHHDAQAPTCTEIGWNAYDTCSRCDYTTYEELPALGHDWSAWTVTTAPTCTEKGVETRTCSRCNETETRDVAALGHDLIHHDAQAPTCTEIGWNSYDTCSRCDYTTYEELPALGHDWSTWTVTTAPTCTEKGVETRTCSRCNETETRDVAALGHDLIHHDAQAPTCTEIGWNAYDTCSRCDYTTYEELPALGHNPGAAKKENNVEPTCTEAGSYDTVIRCTRCNEVLESTHTDVPALGHDWSDWAVTTAPTCTEKGVDARICSRCNETETRDIAALGHTPAEAVKENNVEPTCTENGGFDMVVYCATCGAELSRTHTDLAALGHDWDDGVIQDAASCTEDGVKLFTCRRCGETKTEVISATGHTPGEAAKENNVPATCTTAGSYDMVVRCTVCNAVISTEHFDVDALGHDYQAVVTAPTCTEKGYTTYTCSRCGDSYVSDETAELGHDWGEWAATTAATCTNTGIETRTCSRCGETESREIAALGHDWDATTYVWSDDYTQVTATRICKHDTTHKEVETAQSTSEVTVEPTVDTEGEIKYTATFTNPAFEAQVKVVVLPKLDKPGLPCDGDETCPGKVFTDMPKKGHWAHDAIDWAIVNGVTKGTSDTTFSPNQTCTRAQIVTFLWRAAGSPEPQTTSCAFTDVKESSYYYKAVLWAAEKGITAGTSDTTFSPNDGCTREQVVTFIWRFAGSPEPKATTCPFNDIKAGSFSYKAILWAAENGVTAGTSETTFSPKQTCTRAQIVTFLWRHMVK